MTKTTTDNASDAFFHIDESIGEKMHELMKELFPLPRSITGNGVRDTLKIIKRELPDLIVREVPTGTKVFDWEVPKEWNCYDAYIVTPDGQKICDFKKNNLHLIGYSVAIDRDITLSELRGHLLTLPEQPDAIPYSTSYYKDRWGFCITYNQYKRLEEGNYKVYIDSSHADGFLTYAELKIPSTSGSNKEVFLSTYICHPSMANNELSGPVVTTWLSMWLKKLSKRKYNYRIVFLPETIGSLTYLNKNLNDMKKNIVAGFNITCVGDERCYSYLPSRDGSTLSDKVAIHVLKHLDPDYKHYTYFDRGSDERQYCSPGVDLPIASVMRSKYHEYPEYHTSLDDLTFVTPEGLLSGYKALQYCLSTLECNDVYKYQVLGEPQLSSRGLYPSLSEKSNTKVTKSLMNLLAYADGTIDLLQMAETLNEPIWKLREIADILVQRELLSVLDLRKL